MSSDLEVAAICTTYVYWGIFIKSLACKMSYADMKSSEFSKLLERYRRGLASPEEIKKIDDWYSYIGKDAKKISEPELSVRKERTLNKILANRLPDRKPQKSIRRLVLTTSAAAASLLFIMFYFFHRIEKIESPGLQLPVASMTQPEKEERYFFNPGNSNRLVLLQDGSTVLLTPNSSLICEDGFGITNRRTKLIGNGFFEIMPDSHLPFLILCEEIITRVHGTSFWIKSSAETKMVEISVHTGEVSVFKKNSDTEKIVKPGQNEPVTLLANQKAHFSIKSPISQNQITRETVDMTELQESNDTYRFENSTLDKVFHSVADHYNLDIKLRFPNSGHCTFTGDLNGLTLREKLDIICFSTGASYEVNETELIVSGTGCY